jgi:hypothetical protein
LRGYNHTCEGEDSYCYPGTSILRNKQGIRDYDALLTVEREITSLKLLMLREKLMRWRFALSCLRAIHRLLRHENIAKYDREIPVVLDFSSKIFTIDPCRSNNINKSKFALQRPTDELEVTYKALFQ